MHFSVVVKRQQPTHLISIDTAHAALQHGIDIGIQPHEVTFVSMRRVNSELPPLPKYLHKQDPSAQCNFNFLNEKGEAVAFYVINADLGRITFDHCFDDQEGEFEFIFDLKQKEAASE